MRMREEGIAQCVSLHWRSAQSLYRRRPSRREMCDDAWQGIMDYLETTHGVIIEVTEPSPERESVLDDCHFLWQIAQQYRHGWA